MEVKRTVQIIIENDPDLRATLDAFQQVCSALSPLCWNNGKPFGRRKLHDVAYHQVKGIVRAQMTQTALRLVAGCYSKKKRKKLTEPVKFKRPFACFLVGKRGRDARFCPDGTISLWTVGGRKRLRYYLPSYVGSLFHSATQINSITVKERNGKLIGYVCITLPPPEATGTILVGVDRNETNPLVAVKEMGEIFFKGGVSLKVWRTKHRKKLARLQRKLAERKGQRRDTRSVRRRLQHLRLRQRHYTKTYCHTVAKRLVEWAGRDAILVLEQLRFPQGKKGSAALNRRLSQFPHGLLLRCIKDKAAMAGIPILMVNPAYTSQTCPCCAQLGNRQRHKFSCPHCGFSLHADVAAAWNLLRRAEKLLSPFTGAVGRPSVVPEAPPFLLWQGQGSQRLL